MCLHWRVFLLCLGDQPGQLAGMASSLLCFQTLCERQGTGA